MQKFSIHQGFAAPLFRANIDTDQIIPKQFLKRIERSGFGAFLFYDWRFDQAGSEIPGFVLNLAKYKGASILLAGKNFGCGSSREHAPWALEDFGFRVIIAPSFADIFYNNCFKVGLLPVVLPEATIAEMVRQCEVVDRYDLTVDLEDQVVIDPNGFRHDFTVDGFRKYCLQNGLDDIGLTLQHEDRITEFESRRLSF